MLLGLASREGRTDCPEAEPWYRLGFERAHRLGARISELRATRLYRVAPAGAPEAAARRVLAEIHATFTEGFDCRDLEGAREILDAG